MLQVKENTRRKNTYDQLFAGDRRASRLIGLNHHTSTKESISGVREFEEGGRADGIVLCPRRHRLHTIVLVFNRRWWASLSHLPNVSGFGIAQ